MTAREYAAALTPDSGIRWRALEIAAFEAYPSVLRQLDPRGGRAGATRRPSLGFFLALPAMILLGAMFLAPVAGITTLIGDRFGRSHPDPAVAVPISAVLFLCTIPLLAISFVRWMRAGRRRDRLREYQAGMVAVLGVLSVAIALIRSGQEDFAAGPNWTSGIAVPAVLGAAFWAALLAARRTAREDAPTADSRVVAIEPLKRVREAVEKLPIERQREVRADLDAAIDELTRRAIIRPADAEVARAAELGKLALRMSQGARSGR